MTKPKTTPLAINEPLSQNDLDVFGPPHNPTGPKIANPDALELAIYEDQELQITAKYGEEATQSANYGWAVEVEDDVIGIATKVYTNPPVILCSEARADGVIDHVWMTY